MAQKLAPAEKKIAQIYLQDLQLFASLTACAALVQAVNDCNAKNVKVIKMSINVFGLERNHLRCCS